ncbi:MAG: STAS/SEC14 domain-containing protein [Porticoccaceae bacterium]|nr:STAS/SEC14 domain-containing protein [Porticoccaceae bacterium]
MLEMMEIDIDNAIAFRIAGKVTEDDMSVVLNAAKLKIEQYGNIVFLEQIDSFGGIELAAIVAEFKYLFDVGMGNISKVAVVSDKQWLKNIVSIEDKIFRNIKIRSFSIDDRDSALEFLKAP